MAYLASHSNKVILNRYDLEGLQRAMGQALDAAKAGTETDYRAGAYAVVELLLGHEFNTQENFMRAFDELCEKWEWAATPAKE